MLSPISGSSTSKLSAINAPIFPRVSNGWSLFGDLKFLLYIIIGTFSLVWSKPLNVGSLPWSAVIISKSSNSNLLIIIDKSTSNSSIALANPSTSRTLPYNDSKSHKLVIQSPVKFLSKISVNLFLVIFGLSLNNWTTFCWLLFILDFWVVFWVVFF